MMQPSILFFSQYDLLVVHANPKDVYTHIAPQPEIQHVLLGEVFQPDDDPGLKAVLHGVEASVIAFGHFHFTFERSMQGLHLVDVSPCHLGHFGSDKQARFTLFTWNGKWQMERHYVEYDYNLEKEALLKSDMPGKEKPAENLG